MTTKHHNLTPTACWKSDAVSGLERTWLPSIELVELPQERWSVSLYSKDIEENVGGCIFPTRAAAIRSEVAAAIRHARDLVAERRSGITTVFSITDEQFRTYVAWLRGIVAEEASRKQAKIESFERGCRRATDWIADREVELGVAGMHPSADGYPKQLAAAWTKYNEFQGMLAKLKTPIVAPAEPAAFTPPAWVRSEEDDGVPLQAIADALPNRHASAWMEERQRLVRLATATVQPFETCIDLGRNLGASVQIRPTEDGEAWEVAHDCEWGGGGYVSRFKGRHVTRKGAFSVAAKAIRKEAMIPIEAAKVRPPVMCIGAKDTQRANKILGWLDGLEPPGPDEVAAPTPAPTKLQQLERMYDEFVAMRRDLDGMIEDEERKAKCRDVEHFRYPVAAKAARKRRDDLSASIAKLSDQILDETGRPKAA